MNTTNEKEKINAGSGQSPHGLQLGLLGLTCLAAVSVAAPAQTFNEFNALGVSATTTNPGIIPLSINTDEVIAGHIADSGFVGTAGGTITSFDVAGAVATVANSINNAGAITGNWSDANAGHHGFVRAADGTITTFNAPDASTAGYGKGTFHESINSAGVIAGYCNCEGERGFVRAADGTITNFDVPDATLTLAFSINVDGAIAGYYGDNGSPHPVYHGYIRTADGTITTFDAPGAGTSENSVYAQGTFALSVNDEGVVTGYYVDASDGYHGFVRPADGAITILDAPGAGTGTSPLTGYPLGTKALSISDDGATTGYYIDANEAYHGFMVSVSGAITTFNAPGATQEDATGTFPTSINGNGVIIGYYCGTDGSTNGCHGFQLTP